MGSSELEKFTNDFVIFLKNHMLVIGYLLCYNLNSEGIDECWCASWSSKPVWGINSVPGGFDSHIFPPIYLISMGVKVRSLALNKNVMVCVTQQKTCSKLIYKGNDLIDNDKDNLYIVHIINKKDKVLYGDNDGDALEYLFDLAKKMNAELIVQRSNNTKKSIIKLAKERGITHIILGKSNNESNEGFQKTIANKLKDINIIIE